MKIDFYFYFFVSHITDVTSINATERKKPTQELLQIKKYSHLNTRDFSAGREQTILEKGSNWLFVLIYFISSTRVRSSTSGYEYVHFAVCTLFWAKIMTFFHDKSDTWKHTRVRHGYSSPSNIGFNFHKLTEDEENRTSQ